MGKKLIPIKLANPRGYCAGVNRAIEIVLRALALYGSPVYVRHEVVHNRYVVENLKQRGACFVQVLDEIPDDNIVVFSAHGVSQEVRRQASARGLKILDATCPLVTKVHLQVLRHAKEGREVVLIGHAGHPEVEGTMGQYESTVGGCIYLVEKIEEVARLRVQNPETLAYVTQTTLSVDDTKKIIRALQERFPKILGPRKDDICFATQNRQDAVRLLAQQVDLFFVVGSPNSSNSNRLRELAERMGARAFLVDHADQIRAEMLNQVQMVGVTAGASAPEALVRAVVERLRLFGCAEPEEMAGELENLVFSLPAELRQSSARALE